MLPGDYVQVELRVNGRTQQISTSFGGTWTATASMTVH